MSRLAGFPTDNPDARKLQIRVKGKEVEIVDKETQEPIAGVTRWQVDMTLNTTIAKVEIAITDPADIFVSEVEGSIIAGLPERTEKQRQLRQALDELEQLGTRFRLYD